MLASRILWYLDATGSMSPSDCVNDAGSAPQRKSNFSSSMANTTSYNRNALLTLDTLTPSVLPQKMPMFQKWHCFGDVFVHVVSTQAAPKSLSRAAISLVKSRSKIDPSAGCKTSSQPCASGWLILVPRVPKGSGSECPILVAQMPSNAHQKVEYWIPWLLSLFLLALPKYVDTGIAPNAKNTTAVWLNQNARSHYMGPDWPAPL